MSTPLAIVILAAGKGTRMRSPLPKVLHPLAGRPMLAHLLEAVQPLNAAHTLIITGHEADQVEALVTQEAPQATCIRQTEQNGTGHAVQQTQDFLKDFQGTVLIMNGDTPLLTTEALQTFLKTHHTEGNTFTQATTILQNPTGMGRIIRDDEGHFLANKEHKDCTEEERAITEVNIGLYATHAPALFQMLERITNDNAQKEYYLPDIMHLGLSQGKQVEASPFPQPAEELGGINTCLQLSENEQILQNRYRTKHMLNGVILQNPATTFFSWDTQLASHVTVEPNVYFGPHVVVEEDVTIRAFSHLEGCTIQKNATIGPFARLRPQAHIGEGSKIGNFVEVKKSDIAANVRINHLSYIGDTTIGQNTNIGAGTITANYDHHAKAKHSTTIGENVALGANSVLVAPVSVGDDAKIGAHSVLRKNAEPQTLTVTKAETLTKQLSPSQPKKA